MPLSSARHLVWPEAPIRWTSYHLIPIVGLAFMVPLLPYVLEMMALRTLPTSTFGILMSLEPALGALAGFVILGQAMTLSQMLGVGLVVAASIGATLQ